MSKIDSIPPPAGDTNLYLRNINARLNAVVSAVNMLSNHGTSTGDVTLTVNDRIVGITATPATVSLPGKTVAGTDFLIQDESGTAFTDNITVIANGTETINGSSTALIASDYGNIHIYSNGSSEWFTISRWGK